MKLRTIELVIMIFSSLFLTAIRGQRALAEPVIIEWGKNLDASAGMQLDIVDDPLSGKMISSDKVAGSSRSWDCPKEEVYHWTIKKDGYTPEFIGSSGAFLCLFAKKAEKEKPLRLKWAEMAGSKGYLINYYSVERRLFTSKTDETFILVNRMQKSSRIEVRGILPAGKRPRVVENLSLESDVVPTPAPSPIQTSAVAVPAPTPAPSAVVAAPPPAETSTVATPAPVAEVTPAPIASPVALPPPAQPAAVTETPSGGWQSRIMVLAATGEEKVKLNKLEVDLNSIERPAVFGGHFDISSPWAIVFGGSGSVHQHGESVSQELIFGVDSIQIDEQRVNATFDLGLDFWKLAIPEARSHFTVLLTYAPTTIFVLPLEFQGAPGVLPAIETLAVDYVGPSIWLSLMPALFNFEGRASYLQHPKNKGKLVQGMFVTEYRFFEPFNIGIGAIYRLTELERCHTDSSICLAEGKVLTRAEEMLGFLSMGVAF